MEGVTGLVLVLLVGYVWLLGERGIVEHLKEQFLGIEKINIKIDREGKIIGLVQFTASAPMSLQHT